jgi:hypothetical protein
MSDNFNKPKNIAQIGESFEDHLNRLGKISKQTKTGSTGSESRQMSSVHSSRYYPTNANVATNKNHRSLSSQARDSLNQYKETGQHIQILKVWSMLMQAFDSKLRHFFGDEPDAHFMKFAASLTPDAYKRLEANLLERLDEDREWPPSLIRLHQLANSPTKEAMYKARQNLFHRPVPMTELGRVELYIKKYKMHEVRHFSERQFETEFNRKYTQWFREVMLDDMDIKVEAQQTEIHSFLQHPSVTELDKKIDADISSGKAFNHKLGQRILDVMKAKAVPVAEDQSPQYSVEEEQEQLAAQIRQELGGGE